MTGLLLGRCARQAVRTNAALLRARSSWRWESTEAAATAAAGVTRSNESRLTKADVAHTASPVSETAMQRALPILFNTEELARFPDLLKEPKA